MAEDAKWSMEWDEKMLMNVNNFTMAKGLIMKFMSKFVGLFSIVRQLFKDV